MLFANPSIARTVGALVIALGVLVAGTFAIAKATADTLLTQDATISARNLPVHRTVISPAPDSSASSSAIFGLRVFKRFARHRGAAEKDAALGQNLGGMPD